MTAAPGVPLTGSHPPRLGRAAVEQHVSQLIRRHLDRPSAHNRYPRPVILLRAEPVWVPDKPLRVQGRSVRVEAGVSPLAVLTLITEHTRDSGGPASDQASGDILVILTDQEESALGRAVLGLVVRQRIHAVDRWTLVAEQFGAQTPEARLTEETWAAEALMSAKPPNGGWPKLPGKILSRDVALRHLAASRLGLSERLGLAADDLDISTLLRWSAVRGATEALASLRAEEREGLVAWLSEITGRAGTALFSLIQAEHGQDALAVGIICHALWSPHARDMERQKGRLDRYFGDARGEDQLDDATMRAFGEAAHRVVSQLLHDSENESVPGLPSDVRRGRTLYAVLERAEELLQQFGAQESARYSDVLRSGFAYRVDAFATALRACVDNHDGHGGTAARAKLAWSVSELTAHRLHRVYALRVERAQMAQRLVEWLTTPLPETDSVGAGVDAYIGDWSWVDRAVAQVQAGEDAHAELERVYRRLYERVAERRRELDRRFAALLADWTGRGTTPKGLLTVESLLERVVAPVVEGDRPVLFIVVDGMSGGDAIQVAGEMRRSWEEYDPLGGTTRENRTLPARRRGAVAALPAWSRVSRTSLLTGSLSEGDQELERDRFARHSFWQDRAAKLFHAADVRGDTGDSLSPELTTALANPQMLVGVVLNTRADALGDSHERNDPQWRLNDLGVLRMLLEHAGYHGRAVVITSSHGHTLGRDGQVRGANDALSTRHREGTTPTGAGEVELAGPRVIAPDRRIVALWDTEVRYSSTAGRSGGAAAAEVCVPVLAFLPLGAVPPEHWRALGDSAPAWWNADGTGSSEPAPGLTSSAAAPKQGKPRAAAAPEGQTSLELARPGEQLEEFLDELLASEMFAVRKKLTPREVAKPKIRAALSALLEAGCILPVTVLGERVGEQPARAMRFTTVLQRVFNVDDYPVLSVTDNGRTVRLDKVLLRQQFELKGDV